MPDTIETGRTPKKPGVDGHRTMYAKWNRYNKTFTFLHYTIGPLATISAVLAASKFIESFNVYSQNLVLFLSATLTALLAFLRPAEQADRYQAAWALLGNEIDRYDAGEVSAESVRRACVMGEAIVRYTAPVAMPGADETGK